MPTKTCKLQVPLTQAYTSYIDAGIAQIPFPWAKESKMSARRGGTGKRNKATVLDPWPPGLGPSLVPGFWLVPEPSNFTAVLALNVRGPHVRTTTTSRYITIQ